MGILNGLLISTKPRIPFTDFQNFRSNQVENTSILLFSLSFHGLWWVGCQKIRQTLLSVWHVWLPGYNCPPRTEVRGFFQNRYSDISYMYICQISFTLLRVFHSGRGNNNRHLFNSSFTHIFHPVGFPLTDKSFLGNPTLKMMKKTRCNQFCRLFPPPPNFQWESSMVYLSAQKTKDSLYRFSGFQTNSGRKTPKQNKFLKSFIK